MRRLVTLLMCGVAVGQPGQVWPARFRQRAGRRVHSHGAKMLCSCEVHVFVAVLVQKVQKCDAASGELLISALPRRWNRQWTAEENRHGDLMNKYCYLTGRVNMKARFVF